MSIDGARSIWVEAWRDGGRARNARQSAVVQKRREESSLVEVVDYIERIMSIELRHEEKERLAIRAATRVMGNL